MEKEIREFALEQKESLKLMRMSKGYQWEIKIFIADDKSAIERIERLDNDLKKIYIGDLDDES